MKAIEQSQELLAEFQRLPQVWLDRISVLDSLPTHIQKIHQLRLIQTSLHREYPNIAKWAGDILKQIPGSQEVSSGLEVDNERTRINKLKVVRSSRDPGKKEIAQ